MFRSLDVSGFIQREYDDQIVRVVSHTIVKRKKNHMLEFLRIIQVGLLLVIFSRIILAEIT